MVQIGLNQRLGSAGPGAVEDGGTAIVRPGRVSDFSPSPSLLQVADKNATQPNRQLHVWLCPAMLTCRAFARRSGNIMLHKVLNFVFADFAKAQAFVEPDCALIHWIDA